MGAGLFFIAWAVASQIAPPPPTAPLAAPAPPAAAPAVEEIPPTRLVYAPGRFASVCPTEVEIQEGVTRRIGRTPFAEPPERIVVLAIDGAADQPTLARAELLDTDFQSLGARRLESTAGCTDLVEAAELAISIALAPSLAFAPPPAAPAVPPVPVPVPVATPVEPEMAAPPASSFLPPGIHLVVGAALNASLLLGPDPAIGATLSAALRSNDVELRFEHREHVPGYSGSLQIVHGGGVNTLAPCGHLALWDIGGAGERAQVFGCGTVSYGALWALGAYIGGSPYTGIGARVGAEWSKQNMSSLRAWAEVEWSLNRPQFYALSGTLFWAQDAPVNVTFGLSYELPWGG